MHLQGGPGGDARGLTLLSAMWCRYCFGVDENGTEIAPNDPSWHLLQPLAQRIDDGLHGWAPWRIT